MPQHFSPRFHWWYYDERSEEAVIVLDKDGGDENDSIRVLDLVWLRNCWAIMGDSSQTQHNQIAELTSQLAKLFQTNLESQSQRLSDSLKINVSLNNSNFALWSRMIKVAIGAKALWNALVTTYSSGKDKLQTFDLHVKANNIKQEGKSVEELWLKLQGIWGEIEMRDPNPMEHPNDIIKYNNIRSEQKLFQFLNALDQKHDNIKRELLRIEPLPSVEAAYAAIRKENAHQTIFGTRTDIPTHSGIASGLVAPASRSKESDGHGLISNNHRRSDYSSSSRDRDNLKCDECGMKRHTKEQCFKVIGYPEWSNNGHKKGKAAIVTPVAATGGNQQANNSGTTTKAGFGLLTETNAGKMGLGMTTGELGLGILSPNSFSILQNTPSLDPTPPHNTFKYQCLQKKPSNQNDIRTGEIIGRGTECDGLYYVDEVTQDSNVLLAHGTPDRQAWLWHRRLGHPSSSYLSILFPNLFSSNKTLKCETCIQAKSHQNSYKTSNTKTERPFALVHSDVWGPARVNGGHNFRYFLLFIDDCTRMTWTFFKKNKYEVFDKFTMFFNMIQTQFKSTIQILRSDNGGEFVNSQMSLFCEKHGIIHQTTCPHTPPQNGVVEMKNRILLEITRALMIESNVPKSFWPEALATATYLVNRLPTRALDLKNPLEALTKFYKPPSNLTLNPRIFGCSVFVHIPKNERTKLDACAEKCVFVGYGVNQKGYRCYSPKKRHMFTTMNCDFLETEYFYATQHTSQGETTSDDNVSWLDIPSSEEVTHSTPSVSTTAEDLPDRTEVCTEFTETNATNPENERNMSVQENSTGQTEHQDGPEPGQDEPEPQNDSEPQNEPEQQTEPE
ncbi:uncharacterized protein [Rutidosis leptorrhynchoides]|uniref:uncharacterized protein n=1 Tax=Rutidosis leptorrhynchoides TaxID=125765 RepID=UPI003A99D8AF